MNAIQQEIFIHHIGVEISISELCHILQNNYSLGIINHIEHLSRNDYHYTCFVRFQVWNIDNPDTRFILSNVDKRKATKVYYDAVSYFVISRVRCRLRVMDLTLNVHEDTTIPTIRSVIEGLDLGKVNRIEVVKTAQPFQNNEIWQHVNVDHWTKHVKNRCNSVTIYFDYWYRTKSTYAFIDCMRKNNRVDIPISYGCYWTFMAHKPPVATKARKLVLPQLDLSKVGRAKHTYFVNGDEVKFTERRCEAAPK